MIMRGFCILTRWPQVAPREFQVGYWETFILRKSSEALRKDAHGVIKLQSLEVLKNIAGVALSDMI